MAQSEETPQPRLSAILGANVYRLRVLKVPRWSQGRLAEQAGVGLTTIRDIEAARDPDKPDYSTRLDVVERLARALNADPADLLRYDGSTRVYLQGRRPGRHLAAVPTGAALDRSGNLVAPLPGLHG